MSSFNLPPDGEIYIRNIRERCQDLINTGIWSGITIAKLDSWLANFQGEKEEYFAACILDSLIYRSNDQTIALCKHLFQRVIPDLIRTCEHPPVIHHNWLQLLSGVAEPYVRLVAIQNNDEAPIKSSGTLLRLMKRQLKIQKDWIISHTAIEKEIKNGVRLFVFIDDFLGTGDQFESFIVNENIGIHIDKALFMYTPLVAHRDGLDYIKGKFDKIKFSAVEILDNVNEIFSKQSACFNDGLNGTEEAKKFYYQLLKEKGIDLYGSERRGFGSLDIAYAFDHAAPDNSLPILWWDEDGWQPLFNR